MAEIDNKGFAHHISVLSHESMNSQNPNTKLGWATQASELLFRLGGEHTFQPPIQNLQFAIETGHALVATNHMDTLTGYVKMSPWVVGSNDMCEIKKGAMAEVPEHFDDIYNGNTVPVCVEIGSLVVDTAEQGRGLGGALVTQMVEDSNSMYPGIKRIAVVTIDNVASLHVFKRLQWRIVEREKALAELGIDVLDGWEPESTIFIYEPVLYSP